MIEVMVNGCNGKMGQIVCDLVDKNPNMILKCGADKVDTGYFTYQVYTNLDKIPEKPDVIIDFSIPVATFGVLEYAKKNNVPVVIATTGFTGEEEKKIVEKAISELENKLDTTECSEELKFTPQDILLKRDIEYINKIKLDKEYQERTKTWKNYTRHEQAELIMKYVDDIELALVGNEVVVKQINFRESICKPCQELYDNGYIDTTKPMILGNVLGSVRFSNYLPEEEVGEIIMRLRQYYDVHYTEATYYVDKQMFYFNFAEDNSAIVRVFPLEDYYKLDTDNKMETYKFGIIYINEEDKFQMQEIDTAFDYIPDESNYSVIYMKEPTPISVGVKPVKFCEDTAR